MRANIIWILAGNTVYGFSQWLMLIALAKLGTPELVGQFALAFAITAPVIMAANLNLRTIIATDSRGTYTFSDYLALRLSCLAGANATVALIVALLYRNEIGAIVIAVAIAKSIESISDVFVGLMQQHEHMDWVSRSLGLKAVASIVGLVGGLYVGGSLLLGVVGLMCAWTVVLVGYDVRQATTLARAHRHALSPAWRWREQRMLFRLTLPLGLATLLASLQTNVPRFFVERLLGARDLGFFAASTYLMIVGARIMTSLGDAASPRLALHVARADAARFGKLILQLLGIMLAVALAAITAAAVYGAQIMSVLYTPEYASQSHVLLLVLLAAAFGYGAVLLHYALTAARVLRPLPFTMGGSIAVTAIACVVLVPRFGNVGAGVAMCVGSLVQLTGNAVVTTIAVRRMRGRS